MSNAVLKLNVGYVPFETCSVRDAVWLMAKDRGPERTAYALTSQAGGRFYGPHLIPTPSVMIVPTLKFLPRKGVGFSSLAVVYRDDMNCQYCGDRFPINKLEVDHVIPRSRFAKVAARRGIAFGVTSWENCVAACRDCNQKKKNLLCEEAKMFPLRAPHVPKYRPSLVISIKEATENGWMPYLDPFRGKHVRLLP